MRYFLALAAVAGVAACAQEVQAPRLHQVEAECGYSRKQFVEAWPCISVGYAYPGDDIRAAYIAKGNYAAEQVREGRMTDAEARMLMADAYQQAVTTYSTRRAADSAPDPVEMMVVGRMANPRPTYQITPPPVQRTVNCYPVGNTVQCN